MWPQAYHLTRIASYSTCPASTTRSLYAVCWSLVDFNLRCSLGRVYSSTWYVSSKRFIVFDSISVLWPDKLISNSRFEGRCHFFGIRLLIWHINHSLKLWDLRKQWVVYLSSYYVLNLAYHICFTKLFLYTFVQPRVAERHILDLRKKYGNVLAADLVNKVHGIDCVALWTSIFVMVAILPDYHSTIMHLIWNL